MREEIMRAGVEPGGPWTQTEIKALLCYMLSKTGVNMSFMQLYETLAERSLVNYFDLVDSVEQLCRTGHIEICEQDRSGSELYCLTRLGIEAGDELGSTVSLSAREKAMESVAKVLKRARRQSEVEISVSPVSNGGFTMELSIPDMGGELVRFSLFVPTKEDCDLIKRRFLNAPQLIYSGVLDLLYGRRGVVGKEFQVEELF